ncbi:hypothetical protein U1Q18_050065, partial [Sarracenia purpurea var. burkii]
MGEVNFPNSGTDIVQISGDKSSKHVIDLPIEDKVVNDSVHKVHGEGAHVGASQMLDNMPQRNRDKAPAFVSGKDGTCAESDSSDHAVKMLDVMSQSNSKSLCQGSEVDNAYSMEGGPIDPKTWAQNVLDKLSLPNPEAESNPEDVEIGAEENMEVNEVLVEENPEDVLAEDNSENEFNDSDLGAAPASSAHGVMLTDKDTESVKPAALGCLELEFPCPKSPDHLVASNEDFPALGTLPGRTGSPSFK